MHLKMAFMHNPRLQPLIDGAVRIEGVDFEWELGHPADLHLRHLNDNAFDVFEFSMANLLITRDQPAQRERLRWKAIPIFLAKAFLWLNFYVHRDSGIRTFADLKGKRIGIPDFQMTAAVWMRIALRELCGIRTQDIRWVNGRTPDQTHGEGVTDNLAPGIELRRLQTHESLNDLIQRGEVDGAYGDNGSTPVEPSDNVRPLFGPDQKVELLRELRLKTGMTPTNHVLIVQERLVEQDSQLAINLFQAFERSKQEAYQRARKAAEGYLLFAAEDFARQAAVFGEDPYPSGLAANRHMLDAVADQLYSEGLLRERPDMEALFAESTRRT